MNAKNFCYWLWGMFELTEPKIVTAEQVAMIKEHLNLTLTPPGKSNPLTVSNNIPIENAGPFLTYC